jgi:hypothetical protein
VLPREGTKEGENATTTLHVKLQIKSMTLKSNVMMMMMIIIIIIIIIMRCGIKGVHTKKL